MSLCFETEYIHVKHSALSTMKVGVTILFSRFWELGKQGAGRGGAGGETEAMAQICERISIARIQAMYL
jgi:hypothetical protein